MCHFAASFDFVSLFATLENKKSESIGFSTPSDIFLATFGDGFLPFNI
ncbi:Hypothetical protein zj316_2405 [Lactiplantibacillus plantarum ZJ316]|nr:Hypothetical protein zj316_2405 [Lactiplantibacillus plantarum ZJ316]